MFLTLSLPILSSDVNLQQANFIYRGYMSNIRIKIIAEERLLKWFILICIIII